MVATRSTVVKRPRGIPGTQDEASLRAIRQVIERKGPVRPRRSLTLEQQQPASQTSRRSATAEHTAVEVPEEVQRIQRTQDEPTGIALPSRKQSTHALSSQEAQDDFEEQNEPVTQGLHGEQDDEQPQPQEPHEENSYPMRTRDIPANDLAEYEDTRSAQQRANSYVTQRPKPTHQYPAPTSRTRETGGKYPTTSPGVIPASQLDERGSTYHQPHQPQPNVTRRLPQQRHLIWSGHPLTYLGITLLLGVCVYIFVLPWVHVQYDTLRYRTPRIDYAYAVLAGDTADHESLITTINKNGELIVTIYPGDNKAPIALQFQPLVTSSAGESPGSIGKIIPVKTGVDDIEISFNGSTLILEYANHTLKRIM